MPAELAPNLTKPVKSVDEPPVIALKEAPVTAVKPTGDEVAIAEVVELPPMQTASAMKPEVTKQLPKDGQSIAACWINWPAVARHELGTFGHSEAICLRASCKTRSRYQGSHGECLMLAVAFDLPKAYSS